MKWDKMQPQWLSGGSGINELTLNTCLAMGLSRDLANVLANRIFEDFSKIKELINNIKELNSFFLSLGCNEYFINCILARYLRSKSSLSSEEVKNRICFVFYLGYSMEEILENLEAIYDSSVSLEKIYAISEFSKSGDKRNSLDTVVETIASMDKIKTLRIMSIHNLKSNDKSRYIKSGRRKNKIFS